MPHSRANGQSSSPNPFHEPVNSLAVMLQRTKRAIPRRTTPAAQIAFLAPILQHLQQHEANTPGTGTTASRPTSIYYDPILRVETIYEPRMLPPLQRIPIRQFFKHWLAAMGEQKAQRQHRQEELGLQGAAEDIGANGREMERGPWAPALADSSPGSEIRQPDLLLEDPDCLWMRNFDPTTPKNPAPVPSTLHPNHAESRRRRAVARNEALLFSRWLRAGAMSASGSTYADAGADAMATVVYASSPPAPTSSRTATTAAALWRVLVRLIYELLRHLPRTDMLFPRRERARLSREAFRRFLALATPPASIRGGAEQEEEEDALEAGVSIFEALASLTDRDNEREHEQGHDGERDAAVAGDGCMRADEAERERERIRMEREHWQMWKKRQLPMVLIVDLTEVPTEAVETTHHLLPPPSLPPLPHYHSDRPLLLYRRFVAALEAFTERNRAALLLVGRDGVCRMRVAFVDPAKSRLESEWSD
ncbi:hypothetical protein SLS62_006975 [Diatrype stigma]|uniref:Uncharacterized protein n=1 Tax=Diatrype stigma TaxID=117547 RepID=A0AAN9YR87_9PEZI